MPARTLPFLGVGMPGRGVSESVSGIAVTGMLDIVSVPPPIPPVGGASVRVPIYTAPGELKGVKAKPSGLLWVTRREPIFPDVGSIGRPLVVPVLMAGTCAIEIDAPGWASRMYSS